MTIGEKIKSLRKESKMTQPELAKKIGISVPTLQRYENGVTELKPSMVNKIADILGVPVEDLVVEPYKMTRNPAVKNFEDMTTEEMEELWDIVDKTISGLGKALDERDKADKQILLAYYDLLNGDGKEEAKKRVSELSEIPKYKK